MAKNAHSNPENDDVNAPDRKKDHIQLATKSRTSADNIDTRFDYEPMLSGHPLDYSSLKTTFAGFSLDAPIWISSMTGGTQKASIINKNLAKACGEYKLGMGLGSCRQLLYSDEYLKDFSLRKYVGNQPLFANLGIAQIEKLIIENQVSKIVELIKKLEADGLIIHVNPMQEWIQPEGDRFEVSPIQTITRLMEEIDIKIIVKEVGQGMGPESISQLLQLPLTALDFAASGGTNFAMMEILRNSGKEEKDFLPLVNIGHSADDMVEMTNKIIHQLNNKRQTNQLIISGGIGNYLDGYYLIKKSVLPAIYGKASGFLTHAMGDYSQLQEYVISQLDGLAIAYSFLKINKRNSKNES